MGLDSHLACGSRILRSSPLAVGPFSCRSASGTLSTMEEFQYFDHSNPNTKNTFLHFDYKCLSVPRRAQSLDAKLAQTLSVHDDDTDHDSNPVPRPKLHPSKRSENLPPPGQSADTAQAPFLTNQYACVPAKNQT